jgi:hypothetical protein
MKNLLSENMLRFGTKNLSESAQRELVLKSIMETINEHGLHNAVRSRLMEQTKEDPAWLKTAKDALMGENSYPFLSIGILKAGATYSTPTNMVFFTLGAEPKGKARIGVIAKGSTWKGSTSLTVAYCPMTVYDGGSDLVSSPGQVFDINTLQGNTLQELVNGTYKVNGKVVKGTATNAVWYPTTQNIICTAGGQLMIMSNANDYADDMRTSFLAIKNDKSGAPGPGGQYKG